MNAITHNLQSQSETGFDTCYLPFFLLCVTNALYDKEEFDTDCSRGFLKILNRILSAFLFVGLLTFRGERGGGVGEVQK